jgi:glucan biosynthesis protein C
LTIGVFILGLALVSYLIRIVLPLGKYALDFPSLAYLPQYLSFFIIGVVASRRDWLRTIPNSMGKVGFVAVLVVTLTLFRRRFNRSSRFSRFLSRHSYTVFIVHAPIIVFLAIALRNLQLEHLLKFGLMAVIAVPVCFAMAFLVRKIPLAPRIL